VDDAELARRRLAWKAPAPPLDSGYWKLYIDHVLQADEGADLDFLVGSAAPSSPRTTTDRIEAEFGRLDLLFNNAGTGLGAQTPDQVDPAEWRRVVDANLNGSFYCLSQAFRIMKAQRPMGGRIVNNGSISAYAPRPGSIAYTATKHAVSGLTRTAALDGRPFDIAVGQIDIGNAASEMTERMVGGVPQADGSVRPEPRMEMQSVVDAFLTMARLPLSSNMLFVNVMATKMPFVGRG
jgi:NAD(P)-dependent dehydrogenase (short-subunit alcohol dehydrogenase family)